MLSKIKNMRINEYIIWVSSGVIKLRSGEADWEVALIKTGSGETLQETTNLEESMATPTQSSSLAVNSMRQKWKPLEKLSYQSSGILNIYLKK